MSDRRIPDAECTAFPWWAIINPRQMMHGDDFHAAAGMITGPFFSRAAAEDAFRRGRHRYGKHALVYCMSGHGSPDWRAFCAEPAPAVAAKVCDE